jgi:hypothetical protein
MTIEQPRVHAICKDGFHISIQASEYHYCLPRVNGADIYETVELGYPNCEDILIMEYAEDPDNPTETVYGFVPIEIVNQLIEKHGGIVN